MLNFPANAGLRSEKDYAENAQVQKCYEYFYLGSKTTSSTTVLPQSPKRSKADEEKIKCSKNAEKNQLFQCDEIVIDDETEYCATPKQQQKSFNSVNSNFNQIAFNSNANENFNDKNNKNNCCANIENNGNNTNNNEIINNNFIINHLNNKNDNNNTNKNLISKANFSGSLKNMLQNAIEIPTLKVNCCAVKTSGSSNNPNFNYAKFYEAQKLSQLNSAFSVDSSANNLISASTADSPLQLNSAGNIDVKQNSFSNLNLIFNEDYFPRNSYRNNCKFFFPI